MALIPSPPAIIPAGGNVLGFSLNVPRIQLAINTNFFFDRATVKNAMSEMKRKAFFTAGRVVFQRARRSIKRQGLAKPALKVMKDNPGVSLRELVKLSDAAGNRRTANTLRERIRQIRAKDASPPGTPPFTHRGNLRDKPGIVFAMSESMDSVVIGPILVDEQMTRIAYLHEFGGTQRMRAWVWVPKYRGAYSPIVKQMPLGKAPARANRWEITSTIGTFRYPRRPYMRPAMESAIADGAIPESFRNRFRVGGT